MSFAELARRGIEQILSAFPAAETVTEKWELPVIKRSRLVASLDKLHEIAADEEAGRSLRGKRK